MKLVDRMLFIERLLREQGDLDSHQLQRLCGYKTSCGVTHVLEHMRKAKRIHIQSWKRARYQPPVAVWQLGAGKNATKPPPLTESERYRRAMADPEFAERQRVRHRAKAKVYYAAQREKREPSDPPDQPARQAA
jgi:hypothetical protein